MTYVGFTPGVNAGILALRSDSHGDSYPHSDSNPHSDNHSDMATHSNQYAEEV